MCAKKICKQLNWLLVILASVQIGLGQCPDRRQVWQNVSQPLDQNITDSGLAQQAALLDGWVDRWLQCKLPADSVLGMLLQRRGVVCAWSKQPIESLQWYKKAAQTFARPGGDTHPSALPKVQYLIGENYQQNNYYREAQQVFEQIIRQYRQERNPYYVKSLLQLAYILNAAGDYTEALSQLERGLRYTVRDHTDSLNRFNLLYEQAFSLRKLEQYSAAINSIEQSIELAGRLNDTDQLIKSYEALATIYSVQGRTTVALATYRRALQIGQQAKRPVPTNIYTNIGYMYQVTHHYDQAVQYYKQSLPLQQDAYQQARVLFDLGYVNSLQKNYGQALTHYQQSLTRMVPGFTARQPSQNPVANQLKATARSEYLLDLLTYKADAWLSSATVPASNPGRLRQALATYALADTMVDFMRWDHTGQQSKLFWRTKTHRLYEQALETCFRLNDAASALKFIEKSRAVLLNDKLNELGASSKLSPEQASIEQKLHQHVMQWQKKLAGATTNTPAYAQAVDSLQQAQERQELFVRELEQTNPTYYRYKYDSDVVSLKQVQAYLGEQNASLVTYFVGDSTLYALGITPNQTKLIRLKASAYTNSASQLLALNASAATQNQHFDQYLAVSNRLYRQLLAPLALAPGRVIVSPDGVLLPFDALSRSAHQPDFLIKQYAFSYAYSVNRLCKEATTPSANWSVQAGPFLGIAPVTFSRHLKQASLAGSDNVLNRIGRQFSSATLLTRNKATRQAFSRQAGNYQIIQLFTHAEADSSGHEPALFFADSTLRLSELTVAELLSTELVGLSACKTGIGAHQQGEGVFSLARGFASLGVPSVLTTLWNVESQATYDLTERFYAKLSEGLSKDVALQQAKLDYLASVDLSEQLPNRWAGLLVLGDPKPIQKGAQPIAWGLAGGLFALEGSLWWLHRRRKSSPTRAY